LGAWIFLAHWDPKRGATIERFVIFNSMDKAKKWLHQQRGAYRRDDRSPPRFDRPFSSFLAPGADVDPEQLFLDRAADAPQAEEQLIERETTRSLMLEALARTPSEHLPAMAAVARTGDIDLAVQYLSTQPAAFALGHDTQPAAHRAIVRALKSVAA
jgi:hypothetical protein